MFNKIVDERVKKIKATLEKKAGEYASKEDRFHNFNVAGKMAGVSPEKALYGMMLKHEVSVVDLIEMVDTHSYKLTEELIDEKIGDNINYLVLLEGMLKQRCRSAGDTVYKKPNWICYSPKLKLHAMIDSAGMGNEIKTLSDSVIWTFVFSNKNIEWSSIYWDLKASCFIVVDSTGGMVMISFDGVTWVGRN